MPAQRDTNHPDCAGLSMTKRSEGLMPESPGRVPEAEQSYQAATSSLAAGSKARRMVAALF